MYANNWAWNSNNYSYNPSKKKRRDHSFGRDALGSSNNENNNFEEQSEVFRALDGGKAKHTKSTMLMQNQGLITLYAQFINQSS